MSATADEVLEAIARGIHDANPGIYRPWSVIVANEAAGSSLAKRIATLRRDEARAAIRALPPGWVVANVPGDEPICGSKDSAEQMLRAEGYNDALAAVRASAVEVEE